MTNLSMISRPSRESIWIQVAQLFATRSTCLKPNGAILVKGNRLVSQGYNGSPSGQPHCIDLGKCEVGPDGGCIRTVHAETNCICTAAKLGISTKGSTLYCTSSPCYTCAKLLVNAGVKKVVYLDAYRDPSGIELLKACDVEVVKYGEPSEG